MEGAVIGGLIALLVGLVTTLSGWQHWRYRKQETISILEAGILKTTGEEPLPHTRADGVLKWVHVVLGFTLGPFFLLIGIIAILYQLDML